MKTTKTMASTARKSAKTIAMEIWQNTPRRIRKSTGSAIIVSMAASLIAAPAMDEVGKQAVKDMAHEVCYDWNPFSGMIA
jgi:hypothetical protein